MKLFKLIFISAITLFMFSCNEKETKKAVFQPDATQGKDAVISEGYANKNYSKLKKIHLLALLKADSTDNDSRFLLRIGFSSIPQNANIDSAYIYLNAIKPGHFGKDNDFVAERIKNVWINKEVNWSNQPETVAEDAILVKAPTDKMQNYKIDVSDYVRNVITGKYQNFGHLFKFKNEEGLNKGVRFYSSECEEANKRPKLEVFYTE